MIVAARNEADRIGATLAALRGGLPGAALWVADDASSDGTAEAALAARARRWSAAAGRTARAPTSAAAAEAALSARARARAGPALRRRPRRLRRRALAPLVEAVERGECDLAVAAFSRRVGGGFGVALGFARWAIRRRCGLETSAPISGQRAMRAEVLRAALPFARGYGMEVGMTIDAVRAGYRLREYELDLSHRATGRSLAGFAHRGRQLRDFAPRLRFRGGGRAE